MVSLMPTGEDYRFLYVMLYNMGKGYHIGQDSETKTLQQIMIDDEYEIIYEPVGERDIVVGKKDDQVVGVADLWGPWAINLTEKVDTFPPT
tara:strand:- start:153 stop:425 length:273 start_codon:yes stop_codon:yes gene_type:complete